MTQAIITKLNNKTAVIGVIGLGYVGLPLSLRFSEVGYRVIGFDIDPDKTEKLNRGETYLRHHGEQRVKAAVAAGFEATTNFERASEADALIICVPTPLTDHREPDLSFVTSTMESLLPYLRAGHIVALESTTYPGTTEEKLKPAIEHAGFTVGEDVYLVYSPEREDPGNPDFSTGNIPKVVGGTTPNCLEVGKALYQQVVEQVVPVSSTPVAEMSKLLENVHRAVNIGLVNEMKMVADKMGINIYEVIDAAATKPFGFVPYYPGPGLGGHCIPIDPYYLTWKAREVGVNTRFIELAGEVNRAMPEWVVGKVAEALNTQQKPISGSKILILGIAYKKNVDDMRESPAVEIMQLLQDRGAEIAYSDPHVPVFPKMRKYSFQLESIELNQHTLEAFDCVVLATNHDDIDYVLINEHARLIVDTRGMFTISNPKVFRA